MEYVIQYHKDEVTWWVRERHSNLEGVKVVRWLLLHLFLPKKAGILKGTRDCFASAQIPETRVTAVERSDGGSRRRPRNPCLQAPPTELAGTLKLVRTLFCKMGNVLSPGL